MSNNRKSNYRPQGNDYYMGDNLARLAYQNDSAAPDTRRHSNPKQNNDTRQIQETRPHSLVASIGLVYAVFMIIAMVVAYNVIIGYIDLNIETSRKEKEVVKIRREVQTMTLENDNYEMSIKSAIDYDYIYKVATEELGMVYASQNQIIDYDSEESSYVIQYKDVD